MIIPRIRNTYYILFSLNRSEVAYKCKAVIKCIRSFSDKAEYTVISVITINPPVAIIFCRGKGGGYKLARNPEDYSVLSILLVTEGSLAPVACLEKKPNRCPKVAECKTLQMWEDFEKLVNDYFSNITIADLVNSNVGIDSYII